MAKRKVKKAAKLINGDTRHAMYPDTFAMPSACERRMIQPGDIVKIGMEWTGGGERFWLLVESRDGDWFEGIVADNLYFSDRTGCNYGDIVRFHAVNVIDIDRQQEGGQQ